MPQQPHESPIIEFHEERLSSIESDIKTISNQMVETRTKTEFFTQQISEKMDMLTTGINKLVDKMDHLTDRVSENSLNIQTLEKGEASRLQRRNNIKKIGLSLLLAGGGVFATKMSEVIWAYFSFKK